MSSPLFLLSVCPALPSGMVHGIVRPALTGQEQLRNGHQLKPLPEQTLDHPWQRRRGVLGGVVEQGNGSRLRLGYHPLGDICRREVFPIQTVTT